MEKAKASVYIFRTLCRILTGGSRQRYLILNFFAIQDIWQANQATSINIAGNILYRNIYS